MPHAAKILADSVSPDGVRLTTFEITFPRIILAEFNTHRVFSRNSASSRAIPVEKMLKMVQEDPYIPTHWGQNQKGMQAEQEVTKEEQREAELEWLLARDHAVTRAQCLLEIGIHKQITNRLLEPFMWHTVIVTATEWSNWDHLRDNKMAHPEIQKIAHMMRVRREKSKPIELGYSQWHLPLVDLGEVVDFKMQNIDAKKVSVGRCARVSYLTHDGVRDPQKDIELADNLLKNGHMSPFEHVARPMTEQEQEMFESNANLAMGSSNYRSPFPFCGNFRGWVSLRKTIPHESDILAPR